jgi:periplasmic divalent cation tolerance protein
MFADTQQSTNLKLSGMLQEISTVSTTVGSEDSSRQLAAAMVESRLAACVQIDGPIRSVYRWQGTVNNELEYRLICKTLTSLVPNLIEFIKQKHPYELPEILNVRCECSPEYAHWLSEQVAAESSEAE